MATGEVVIPAGGLTFICSVPGHEAAGMKGGVTVAGAPGERAPAPGGSAAPAAAIAPRPVSAAPTSPATRRLRPSASGTVHDIELEMSERR